MEIKPLLQCFFVSGLYLLLLCCSPDFFSLSLEHIFPLSCLPCSFRFNLSCILLLQSYSATFPGFFYLFFTKTFSHWLAWSVGLRCHSKRLLPEDFLVLRGVTSHLSPVALCCACCFVCVKTSSFDFGNSIKYALCIQKYSLWRN